MKSDPEFLIISNSIRRSKALVERNLKASLAQGEDAHVLFIDQNPTPMDLDAELKTSPRIKILHAQVPSVSAARNLSQIPESVKWIIFCDDDGYLDKDYLSLLKNKIASHPEVEIFAGSIRRTDNQDFYSKRHGLGGDLNRFLFSKLLMGSNFVTTRSAFERLKRFDPRFGAGAKWGSGEETDFAWKAFFAKVKMLYSPELVVFHIPPHEGNFIPEFKKSFRYGVGKGALVCKWLLEEKRGTVLMEMVEMLLLPFVRGILDLIRFRFRALALQFSSAVGRVYGLLTFPFRP